MQDPPLKSRWSDGSRVWLVVDVTMQAEENYYHIRPLRGYSRRVVDETWFFGKTQVPPTLNAHPPK